MSNGEPHTEKKKKSRLHVWILVGLAVGVGAGLIAQIVMHYYPQTEPAVTFVGERVTATIGQVFLRLIMMVVLPLVFSALCLGVIEIGDVGKLGRIGLRTLAITGAFSLIAVLIGITLVNTLQPGRGLTEEKRARLQETYGAKAAQAERAAQQAAEKPLEQRLLDILPANLMREMVGAIDGTSPGNGMLAVMAFALIFGIAAARRPNDAGRILLPIFRAIFAVTMEIISFAMAIAPLAVACLMFSATVLLGVDVLRILGMFVFTALLGLAIHMFVVYSLALWLIARKSPAWFFRNSSEALVTAFATSSSNATLPVSLRVAREDLGLPPKISRFVLTVGATGNQNGTALYEGVVVLFLAQVFGANLDLGQQVAIVLMAVLAGIGTAGVPGGSMPLIVGILNSIKSPGGGNPVPGSSIALILGVDRLLDMARTTVNVIGDLVIAVCVAAAEKEEDVPEGSLEDETAPEEHEG